MGALGRRGTLLSAVVGARSPRRILHIQWHPTPHGRGHPSPLAQQGIGGVVYAYSSLSSGSMIVSFEGCNIIGNIADQVSMMQQIMR